MLCVDIYTGVTIVAPVPHVMWRSEWRDLLVTQVWWWLLMKVNILIRVHSSPVPLTPSLLRLLPPSLCHFKEASCLIITINLVMYFYHHHHYPLTIILVTMITLVILVQPQTMFFFIMRGAFALLQGQLTMAFFKTLSPPICSSHKKKKKRSRLSIWENYKLVRWYSYVIQTQNPINYWYVIFMLTGGDFFFCLISELRIPFFYIYIYIYILYTCPNPDDD